MAKPMDLTPAALSGYSGAPNPHLYSSPNYYAHAFGAYLQASGRPEPSSVCMGRGATIRTGEMLRFAIHGSLRAGITFERVQ